MRNLTLYAKTIGPEHAQAIVFLPGFTGSHNMWNSDFQNLRTRYRLIFVDTLGFGRSPKPDISYSINDHLDAIKNTLQSLNVENVHIVGYSMGSLLALAYAHRYPDSIGKVVLIALTCYQSEQEARERIKNSSLFNRLLAIDTPLARIACTIMCFLRPLLMFVVPMFARDVPAVVAKDALRHTWTSYSRTLQNVIFTSHAQAWLQEMTRPILIIQGKHDRIAPIENVQQAIDQLPHVRLIAFESGHRLVFTHSAAITAEITGFLQGNGHV